MDLKKGIITCSILAAVCASAKEYVIIVQDTDTVNYEKEIGYTETVTYSNWIDVGSPNCNVDKEASTVYYGQSFSQTESCTQDQERTVTTTKDYNNGYQETLVEQESNTLILTPTTNTITGTHLEKTCKDVKTFDASLTDGYYTINPSTNMNVYCDMTTSGGGWTVVSKESGSGIAEALYTDAPINESSPSSMSYRMSRTSMNTMQALTSEMRIDCRGTDHLEMSASNLFNGEGGSNDCDNRSIVTYTSASLKGFQVTNKAMCTWYVATGTGVGRGCAGAFHIDEFSQSVYCGVTDYPWTGTPITTGSTDAMSIDAGTKDSSTDCHKSGAERYIMLR